MEVTIDENNNSITNQPESTVLERLSTMGSINVNDNTDYDIYNLYGDNDSISNNSQSSVQCVDISSGEILKIEELKSINLSSIKEYKSESFTKTFKTLIDLTTKPIPDIDGYDDIKSLSSNDNHSDDDDIYSIIPNISKTLTHDLNLNQWF